MVPPCFTASARAEGSPPGGQQEQSDERGRSFPRAHSVSHLGWQLMVQFKHE